jgi:hypothetical protein
MVFANYSVESLLTVGSGSGMMSTRFKPLLNRCTLSRSKVLGKNTSNFASKTGQLARVAWPYVMWMYCENGEKVVLWCQQQEHDV